MMAGHAATKTNKDMAGSNVERDSDTTNYKAQKCFKPVVKPLSSIRSMINRALADIVFLTRSEVETIVENRLTKWPNSQHFQIVKAVN